MTTQPPIDEDGQDIVLPALLTPDELAEIVKVDVTTLSHWRATWRPTISPQHRKGPRPFKIGKFARYRVADVNAWLNEQYEAGTS